MAEGEPKEPPIWIAPAQPFRYDPETGLFCVRQDGSLLETKVTLSQLTSITDLDPRLDRYPESQLGCETGLLLGSGGSLIELPNLRKALAEVYRNRQRGRINREVKKTIRTVYRTLNPGTTLIPKISSAFDQYGVFELQVEGVGLFAKPNSYAVFVPDASAIMTNTSDPLAYWRNPGSQAAVISLYAGAGTLASLAMKASKSSSAAEIAA